MKIVDGRLSTGEVIQIGEPWFVDVVERNADWRQADLVEARMSGLVVKVNPRNIVWARVLEKKP